ncbi:MAG: acylneuraminate cytidylyltransferase family protein, partial [Anaerolineae bacterium]|nr:acylneuraminate cytidylyltransferase family protein [Anaerolineae bacterium]
MTARSVAIVPMRHSSERVKGKNYRRFAGKPLYHHIVSALLQCDTLAAIVIDTDSPVIMEDAAVHFPQVKVLERPAHLRSAETPMNDVLLNTILQVEADFYLQTHSTNPLLKPTTIEHALQRFLQHYPAYDSLFGVTRWNTRFWDGLARPMN